MITEDELANYPNYTWDTVKDLQPNQLVVIDGQLYLTDENGWLPAESREVTQNPMPSRPELTVTIDADGNLFDGYGNPLK